MGSYDLFGEINAADELHGRSTFIFCCDIRIGFWINDDVAPGRYIEIWSNRTLIVGEVTRDVAGKKTRKADKVQRKWNKLKG